VLQLVAQSRFGRLARHPPGSLVWCWPLVGWRVLGAAGATLCGWPWPPRSVSCPGWKWRTGRSLPGLLLGPFLLRGECSGSSGVSAGCPPTAADEVPRSLSALDLAGLPEEAALGRTVKKQNTTQTKILQNTYKVLNTIAYNRTEPIQYRQENARKNHNTCGTTHTI